MLRNFSDDNKAYLITQACRRGMKELDLLLAAFCREHLADLTDETAARLLELLANSDAALYSWLFGLEAAPKQFQDLVLYLRHVHSCQSIEP